MKRQTHISILVVILLVAGLVVLLAACSQSEQPSAQGTPVSQVVEQAGSSVQEVPGDAMLAAAGDSLSTFAPKDPFIQQALPPAETSTTVTTDGGGSVTTITTIPGGSGGTTTTFYWTTTTRSSGGGGTTSTTVKPTTTTTAPHLHTLKILSVATISGTPVVTFKVDNTTYKDKRTGDVVSTTWGQVKVVDISTSSKVVTLLHGSETLILAVGQSTFE